MLEEIKALQMIIMRVKSIISRINVVHWVKGCNWNKWGYLMVGRKDRVNVVRGSVKRNKNCCPHFWFWFRFWALLRTNRVVNNSVYVTCVLVMSFFINMK